MRRAEVLPHQFAASSILADNDGKRKQKMFNRCFERIKAKAGGVSLVLTLSLTKTTAPIRALQNKTARANSLEEPMPADSCANLSPFSCLLPSSLMPFDFLTPRWKHTQPPTFF